MKKIVCKFGGTSTADESAATRVKKIVEENAARRYIVVSAPGKRFAGDIKITDLLYKAAEKAEEKNAKDYREIFAKVRERFLEIARFSAADERFFGDLQSELCVIEAKIYAERNEAFASSRGEYLTAKIFAKLLGAPFFDAADLIGFTKDGKLDKTAFKRVQVRLNGVKRAVIPGFYGRGADGEIHTFPRGGGDITGAVIARGVRAELYENWTDVGGVYEGDPKKDACAAALPFLTYREFSALQGASVLHEKAAEIAREAGIPIRILNTFRPEEKGTLIAFAPAKAR